jgi:hypothetical protein
VNAPNAKHKLRGKTQECDHGRLNTFFVVHRLLVRTLLRKISKLWSQDSMPAKKVLFRPDAREVILRGVSALTDAVRVTLGPKSKCVLIDQDFWTSSSVQLWRHYRERIDRHVPMNSA